MAHKKLGPKVAMAHPMTSASNAKPNHVLLAGWEKACAGWPSTDRRPALFAIEFDILRAFVDLYPMGEPPKEFKESAFAEGPIVWSPEAGALTFYSWYWSHWERKFKTSRFYGKETDEVFDDGNPALKLIGLSESDFTAEALQSICISVKTLELLLHEAKSRRKFAMLMENGVAQFDRFYEFEHLLRNAFEGWYAVGDVGCTMPEDAL
jgi:hypothetical protein